ncbi:FAD binding domain protein [Lasiosphaeria hispida]|uniref:FAD binding domain protein n=1 Tax=Lasiosphaeria hispida TaxID=260671 RepID=A0AAJ0H7M7_9PEZI|nr:FAD binding domain protein [Lasiosphaeria hispida]
MASPFRVVVVGAGVSGLAASHCLHAAGIEHVVLERRSEVAPPEGASITIYPQVLRALHQLGCYEPLTKAATPHDRAWTRWADGSVAANSGLYDYLKENHGVDILPLERRKFLEVMYERLPDKNVVRTSSKIKEIKHLASGVEVELSDGSIERGDMVLGCDGVHSFVRSLMWDQAEATSPGLIPAKEKTAFKTYWKCLIGIGPPASSLGGSDSTMVHNTGYSHLVLAQPHCTFFFVFFLLDKPFNASDRVRYTDEDAEALAATVADDPLSESLTFGDLWRRRVRGALISLEEGILEHWHHGRIALAGDAVHKMTPNIALGGNTAIEDIIVLTNHLHHLLQTQPRPDTASLAKTFAAYQAERMARIKWATNTSGLMSRIQAQTTTFHKLGAWLLVRLPDRGAADKLLADYIRAGPKLDFLRVQGFPRGKLAWGDEGGDGRGLGGEAVVRSGAHQGAVGRLLLTVGAALGVAALASATRHVLFPLVAGA